MVRISCGLERFHKQPDAAEQLCRLLSCAPASYRRVLALAFLYGLLLPQGLPTFGSGLLLPQGLPTFGTGAKGMLALN